MIVTDHPSLRGRAGSKTWRGAAAIANKTISIAAIEACARRRAGHVAGHRDTGIATRLCTYDLGDFVDGR